MIWKAGGKSMKNIKAVRIATILIVTMVILSVSAFAVNGIITGSIGTDRLPPDTLLSADKSPEFGQILASVKSKKTGDDLYRQMHGYAYFISVLKPETDERAYITNLVKEGRDLERLISIYRFWLDTDEDISLIKRIYDNYGPSSPEDMDWIEAAFNDITGSKYGVLDGRQMQEYLNRGMTYEDIAAANTLCRKGKLTITQILDRRLSGISWAEIIDGVYRQCGRKVKSGIDMRRIDEYKNIPGTEVLDAIFLARTSGTDVNEYLGKCAKGEGVSGYLNEHINVEMGSALKLLRRQGLWDEPAAVREKNRKALDSLKKKAAEKGMTESRFNELKSRGYNELDILNASELAGKYRTTPEKVLENMDSGRSWQEISRTGVR